jgi:hypothetical protein
MLGHRSTASQLSQESPFPIRELAGILAWHPDAIRLESASPLKKAVRQPSLT